MNPQPEIFSATPRMVRLQFDDIYTGRGAVALQLDGVPCAAWVDSLRMAMCGVPELAKASVQVDGTWLHCIGVEQSDVPLAQRKTEVIAAANSTVHAPPARRGRLLAAALHA